MNKLTQAQIKQKTELIEALKKAMEKLDEARSTYNDALQDEYNKYKEFVDSYNSANEELRTFIGECAEEMSAYFDEKSEKWQEGEAGEAYAAWKDAWEAAAEFDDHDVREPDEAEEPDVDIEDLEALPNGPE
jgi:uncharacterized protein YukE